MTLYHSQVHWCRGAQPFLDNQYSRGHVWRFDGGVEVPASSSPHVVPLPCSLVAAVDPEEAFVASLSSCHMLWFLALAAKAGWLVDDYLDRAEAALRAIHGNRRVYTEGTFPDDFAARLEASLPTEAELADDRWVRERVDTAA